LVFDIALDRQFDVAAPDRAWVTEHSMRRRGDCYDCEKMRAVWKV
jgi:hypothetical protein